MAETSLCWLYASGIHFDGYLGYYSCGDLSWCHSLLVSCQHEKLRKPGTASSLKHSCCPEGKLGKKNVKCFWSKTCGAKNQTKPKIANTQSKQGPPLWECALTWYPVILRVHRKKGKANSLCSYLPHSLLLLLSSGLLMLNSNWFAFWPLEQSGLHRLFYNT